MGKTSKSVEGLGGAIQGFSKVIGPTALGAALVSSVRQFTVFESIDEISTLLGYTNDVEKLAGNAVRQLAVEYGGDAPAQAKALCDVMSSGVSDSEQAITILTQANKLALGGVTDINAATDGQTSVLNA